MAPSASLVSSQTGPMPPKKKAKRGTITWEWENDAKKFVPFKEEDSDMLEPGGVSHSDPLLCGFTGF